MTTPWTTRAREEELPKGKIAPRRTEADNMSIGESTPSPPCWPIWREETPPGTDFVENAGESGIMVAAERGKRARPVLKFRLDKQGNVP